MKVRVIVPILNIRRDAPEARSDNFIGSLTQGTEFFVISKLTVQKNGREEIWFKDQFNRFYFGAGLTVIEDDQLPAPPPVVHEVTLPNRVANALISKLGIDAIWADGERGELATVAILDSGIALDCTDLTEAVLNGLPGPDSIGQRMKNFVAQSTTMDDNFGHGSHCAGLIASRNKKNVVGMAPACTLYVGKISDATHTPSVPNMIAGIRWAAGLENGSPQDIDIIAMSNGSLLNMPDMQPTINEALAKGKILIFSIGNRAAGLPPEGGTFPASCEGVISVGAVDFDNGFLDFTFQFENLTVCCPGINIFSYWIGGEIHEEKGTSQAAAICAGVAALLVSKLKKRNQANIPARVKELLLSSATKITSNNYTYRFINPVQLYESIT